MLRAWINQPSVSQPLHKYHGVRVLADLLDNTYERSNVVVYFTDGPTISMVIPKSTLSFGGWPSTSKHNGD